MATVTYFGKDGAQAVGRGADRGHDRDQRRVDILQRISAGSSSGQAVETVVLVFAATLVCLTGLSLPAGAAGRAIWLLALFVAWSLVSFTWGTVSTQGLQNVLVYLAALLLVPIAATVARHSLAETYAIVSKAFWVAAVVGLGLYTLSLMIAGPGTGLILAARPFGLLGMVLVAWFTGSRAHRPPAGVRRGGPDAALHAPFTFAVGAGGLTSRSSRSAASTCATSAVGSPQSGAVVVTLAGRVGGGLPLCPAASPLLPR